MRVLIVEDEDYRMAIFEKALEHDDWTRVTTVQEACKQLDNEVFDLVLLDRDLGDFYFDDDGRRYEESGEHVAHHLINLPHPPYVFVHSWNVVGAARICDILRDTGVRFIQRPFGADTGWFISQIRKELGK